MAPTVFISYSHADEIWKDRLVSQLQVLAREDRLSVWDDRQLKAGDEWLPRIEAALATADVAVLVISADFLTSDFIRRVEVERLLERRRSEGVRIIPLIARPCAWTRVKWLAALQCRPIDGRALSGETDHRIEADLAALAEEIDEFLSSQEKGNNSALPDLVDEPSWRPADRFERLVSNLLLVTRVPPDIYVAATKFKTPKELWGKIREIDENTHSAPIALRSGQIRGFVDLSKYPWNEVCDAGSHEHFDTNEWLSSDEPDIQRDLVELLNKTVGLMVKPEVRFYKKKKRKYYYFVASEDMKDNRLSYKAIENMTSRDVFKAYKKKKGKGVAYYRHSALKTRFHRLAGQWYLELTPTYHFTWDGWRIDRYYEDRLKKIKQLEHNDAVKGQVVMWAEFLRRKGAEPNLEADQEAPYLQFGWLETFPISCGIEDAQWLAADDVAAVSIDRRQRYLFD